MAPKPSSGWKGRPSLRTTMTSSGAPSALATWAATGTPPSGEGQYDRPVVSKGSEQGSQPLTCVLSIGEDDRPSALADVGHLTVLWGTSRPARRGPRGRCARGARGHVCGPCG